MLIYDEHFVWLYYCVRMNYLSVMLSIKPVIFNATCIDDLLHMEFLLECDEMIPLGMLLFYCIPDKVLGKN